MSSHLRLAIIAVAFFALSIGLAAIVYSARSDEPTEQERFGTQVQAIQDEADARFDTKFKRLLEICTGKESQP